MSKKNVGILAVGIGVAALVTNCFSKKRVKKTIYKVKQMEKIPSRKIGIYEKYFKRIIDLICAGGAIVVFSPLYILIALIVKMKLGSPVLFVQDRPGVIGDNGKETIFKMYKFRTMTDEKDEDGKLLADDMRLTKFGAWLRSTSLDELPEVFNILNGTMSIIGPRPQLVRDMVFMTNKQRIRHTARPGLSGLAQVNGRNIISWEEKFEWDQKYIENICFRSDVEIVLKTVNKVFIKREGITQDDMATAEDYGDYLLREKKIDQEEYDMKQEKARRILKTEDCKTIALLNCHEDDVYCFRKEIIEAFVKKNYNVIISCPDGHRLDCFRDNPNITIEDVNIDRRGTSPIRDMKLTRDYIELFKKYQPDIVCTFTIKPNIYGSIAADLLGIPHINNITGLGSGYQNGGLVQYVVKKLYKVALKKSKKVFFQNQENMKIALKTEMLSSKIPYECIPGSGVNLERFHCSPKEKNDMIIFNYIGRVLKDKRIDDYIEMAKVIKSRHSNVEFRIIGFVEPTETHYHNIITDLEEKRIVHYCGCINDVRPYVTASDAIIHPSSYGEGMSNVLLETAASGRAIITTDISGCKETVEDGVTGYIYQAENVIQLIDRVEAFLSLSDQERTDMGMRGRRKMEKEFDRRIVVEKYIEVVDTK